MCVCGHDKLSHLDIVERTINNCKIYKCDCNMFQEGDD